MTNPYLSFFALACLLITSAAHAQNDGVEVDLEIVFAIDASGSVNDEEFAFQMLGTAAALRDPRIQAAIQSGPNQRIGAALMVWSDAAFPKYETSWHELSTPESAEAFAREIERFGIALRTKRRIGGGTGIGDAIAYALEMLQNNRFTASRRVIDVSGDGTETNPWFEPAPTLPEARRRANAQGVMVNGLAITNDFPFLAKYYADTVIAGQGSFVIRAIDFSDFNRAMREKMLREFSLIFSHDAPPNAATRLALGADD